MRHTAVEYFTRLFSGLPPEHKANLAYHWRYNTPINCGPNSGRFFCPERGSGCPAMLAACSWVPSDLAWHRFGNRAIDVFWRFCFPPCNDDDNFLHYLVEATEAEIREAIQFSCMKGDESELGNRELLCREI